MIPQEIKRWLTNNYGELENFSPASGGCINNGGTARFRNLSVFIKWNSSALYPGMFDAEAKGLDLLRQSELVVPHVMEVVHVDLYDALVLQNIESGSPTPKTMEDFGRKLALMHRISQKKYGLGHNNYMGSLQQSNNLNDDWIEFFITQRLEPQLEIAASKGMAESQFRKQFERLYKILPDILVIDQPALIHGDLWSGNYMIDSNGHAVLIDPAVTYAHREVDLAMTKLFGGFDAKFYAGYYAEYPTEKGLDERLDIYNLYPLLIHLNLFGTSYKSQLVSILKYFNK
ncbi:MAG: fructosamine kinase family protein [Fulvivirga sp.]|uniref:fructosamine kinase family protein n=1 Tax=Fulvivirga sp. TaxID=1931237 RepID=UPI0032F0188C